MAFKPGDVVILKSGGHSMTVVSASDDEITCLWINEAGQLFRETIPAIALEPIYGDGADDDEAEDEEEDEEEEEEEEEDEEEEEEDDGEEEDEKEEDEKDEDEEEEERETRRKRR